MKRRILAVAAIYLMLLNFGWAQSTPPTTQSSQTPSTQAPPRPGPKTFREIIPTRAISKDGLFSVHKVDDKYFFEVPDSIIGRVMMAVTRTSKTTTAAGYGGLEINRQVLQWEKISDSKLALRCVGFVNTSADSSQQIFEAVENSNINPIIGLFEIKALRKDTSSIIDVTDFFKADNQALSMPPMFKQLYKIASQASDRTFIQSIKTFPINTEIKVLRTYQVIAPNIFAPASPGPDPLPAGLETGVISIEFNTSIVLLPKTPMRKRLEDRRVGYFANEYNVYRDQSQRTEKLTFINKYRLEPKNAADAERQKRGEAIEPAKPIIYYIDPATPKQWVKYLIQGVNDWQPAFEKAGWKNAIMAKEWPLDDTTMTLDDARHSVIRYFASDIENAQGPRVSDPRSGEIIEAHINWYHNVMNIFKHLYAIQVGHLDPRARMANMDEALIGRLIRYVASHETGHTIGLLHNWGASMAVPVEKLRDKEYIKKFGHIPSIMEYARFNYVAQPEDGIDIEDLVPRINTYDEWAVKWGYQTLFDTKDEFEDRKILDKQIREHENDPRFWYGVEIHPYDPRKNNEDLGDNQMKANEYGIKNLKKILPLQIDWTREEGKTYDLLNERYNWINVQLNWYFSHVTKYIGGVYEDYKKTDQPGILFRPVPAVLQREAIDFMDRHLFQTPTWLLNKDVIARIRPNAGVTEISKKQETFFNLIYSSGTFNRLIESNILDNSGLTPDELVEKMRKSIWTELDTHKTIDPFRRNLQKIYISRVIALMNQATIVGGTAERNWNGVSFPGINPSKSDISSLMRADLRIIQAKLKTAIPQIQDKMSRYHLQDMNDRITKALKTE